MQGAVGTFVNSAVWIGGTSESDPYADVVADLTATIARRWAAELRRRGLSPAAAVMTTWWIAPGEREPRQVADTGYRSRRVRLSGDLRDVLTVFRSLPSRRLVIVGAEGTGKTALALLLAYHYLKTRAPGEPVPVLFSLSGWKAEGEDIENWLVRQLCENFPDVCTPEVARKLVLRGQILPILDGVDEVAPAARTALTEATAEAAARDSRLVLIVRADGEREAPEAGRRLLRDASVVRVEPLDPRDATDYLTRAWNGGGTPADEAMRKVLELGTEPLKQALTSPLVLSLAAYVLQQSPAEARKLADERRFADPGAIEAYLMERLVPVAYAPRLRHFTSVGERPGGRSYRPASAGRWLTFLAGYLERRQVSGLVWWELEHATGLLSAFVVATVTGALAVPVSRMIGFGWSWSMSTAVMVFLGTAFVLACAGALPVRSEDDRDPTPRAVLIRERRRAALRSVVGGTVFGLTLGYLFASEYHLRTSLMVQFVLLFGVAFAAAALMDSSWGVYVYSRAWLAMTGRLPIGLMRFLEDAHQRGILRQSGTGYEFRHARVRRSLAGARTGPIPAPAADAGSSHPPESPSELWPFLRMLRPYLARTCCGAAAVMIVIATGTNSSSPLFHLVGDRPANEMEVTPCWGQPCASGQYWVGYRWRLEPAGQVASVFGGRGFPILTPRKVTAVFKRGSWRCAAATIAWRIAVDGRLVATGTVGPGKDEISVDDEITVWPRQVEVTAKRTDTASCTADLIVTGPTVLPWGHSGGPG